jgi:hypothetical protein
MILPMRIEAHTDLESDAHRLTTDDLGLEPEDLVGLRMVQREQQARPAGHLRVGQKAGAARREVVQDERGEIGDVLGVDVSLDAQRHPPESPPLGGRRAMGGNLTAERVPGRLRLPVEHIELHAETGLLSGGDAVRPQDADDPAMERRRATVPEQDAEPHGRVQRQRLARPDEQTVLVDVDRAQVQDQRAAVRLNLDPQVDVRPRAAPPISAHRQGPVPVRPRPVGA